MALHAVEDIDDAIALTREFLLPVEVRRWLKLAVVVFFIGGTFNVPMAQFDTSGTPDQAPAPVELPDLGDMLPFLIAVGVGVLILWLLFAIIGAIMEFVFVESLRTGNVALRAAWSDRWRQGLYLFAFRFAITLPVFALFIGWMALFVGPLLLGIEVPAISVGVLLLGLPLLFLVGILYGIVSAFTTVFVVPIMIKDDVGVLSGWRRLWPSIKAEWKQYGAYAVLGFVLTLAAGLVSALVLGIAAFVVIFPFVIIAGLTYLTLGIPSTLGLAILAVLILTFVAIMILIWAVVQVPLLVFLRYYALLVLGDIDPSFDIIPDQRTAIRT